MTSSSPKTSNLRTSTSDNDKKRQRPKRPLSAYNLFFQAQRKELLETLPVRAEGKPRRSHGKIGFRDMAKLIGGKWKQIDAVTKAKFEAAAAQDKLRHEREMAAFKQQKKRGGTAVSAGGTTSSKKSSTTSTTTTSTSSKRRQAWQATEKETAPVREVTPATPTKPTKTLMEPDHQPAATNGSHDIAAENDAAVGSTSSFGWTDNIEPIPLQGREEPAEAPEKPAYLHHHGEPYSSTPGEFALPPYHDPYYSDYYNYYHNNNHINYYSWYGNEGKEPSHPHYYNHHNQQQYHPQQCEQEQHLQQQQEHQRSSSSLPIFDLDLDDDLIHCIPE